MASVVRSPRREPVAASPDARGNTAESFPRSTLLQVPVGKEAATTRRTSSGNSSRLIASSLKRSRCIQLRERKGVHVTALICIFNAFETVIAI